MHFADGIPKLNTFGKDVLISIVYPFFEVFIRARLLIGLIAYPVDKATITIYILKKCLKR